MKNVENWGKKLSQNKSRSEERWRQRVGRSVRQSRDNGDNEKINEGDDHQVAKIDDRGQWIMMSPHRDNILSREMVMRTVLAWIDVTTIP